MPKKSTKAPAASRKRTAPAKTKAPKAPGTPQVPGQTDAPKEPGIIGSTFTTGSKSAHLEKVPQPVTTDLGS